MKCVNIQVILFWIGLAMTSAMSIDELQDFSNFLKETSLLDQPLKKTPSNEDDDEVPISDHAWEESGRFEGDLILNDRQRQLIVQDIAEGLSRNGLKDSTKRWPNNEVIFYIQKEHFTGDQIQAILSGIEELSQASCVKFRPYRKGDRNAVVVQGSRRGCFSQVGYQGGYQVLNLSGRHPVGRGCFRHGTVVHEFLHTLGFYHMQSSPDRDDYIDVIWENIVQPARHNFRKYNLFSVSDFGVGYDYDSVLHYSRKAFSSNGGDTLVPKTSGAEIGQRIGLSEKDSAKLNKMYCDADSENFEAADDVLHSPVIKKKKTPKNKPFDGHGIGYHQGKTVVFKLPAAETYRMPEPPSNQVFDYFSKTSQDMSPTLFEGFGVGKKITYSYKLPAGYEIVEHGIPTHDSSPILFNRTNTTKDNIHNKKDEIKQPNKNVDNKTRETIEDFDEKGLKVSKMKKIDDIYRFYKNIYKPKTDYSGFYNPVNTYKEKSNTDYYLHYSPEHTEKQDHTTEKIPNLTLTRQFIEKLQESKPSNLFTDKNNEREPFYHDDLDYKRETTEKSTTLANDESTLTDVDLPFGKVYPYKKLKELKSIYLLKPQFNYKKYLENKHDFSRLYHPSDNLDRDHASKNAQYALFGDSVPLTVNYPPRKNSNIHTETLGEQWSSEEMDEKVKEFIAYPTNKPSSNYENAGNIEEQFRYGPNDSKENDSKSTPIDKDSVKPHALNEKFIEQVAVVTEKPKIDYSESQEVDHELERRLPAILEKYVNYDSYDITSPCTISNFKIRC